MSKQTIPLSALSTTDAYAIRTGAQAGLRFCVLFDFATVHGWPRRWSVHAVGTGSMCIKAGGASGAYVGEYDDTTDSVAIDESGAP